jgi:hypothetical protein
MKLLFGFLALVPSLALAGVMNGGGGRGVVCRDSRGEIKSAELLDLWEARTLFGRTVLNISTPVWDQVESAFQILKDAPYIPYFNPRPTEPRPPANDIQLDILRYRSSKLKPGAPSLVILRGVNLSDTPDSYEAAVPVGCKVEQIVNFMDAPDEPKILLNQDIVDKLSLTSQAALIVHEALYSELRDSGEKTSIRVRRAVGFAFSGGSFPSMEQSIRGKQYALCMNPKTDDSRSTVYVYKQVDGTLTAAASLYRGEYSLGIYPAEKYTNQVLAELFGTDLEAVATGGSACSTSSTWDLPTLSVSLKGQGPVDFQRAAYLNFRCPNDKLEISLVDGEGKNQQSLKCRVIDDSQPFPRQPPAAH